MLTTCTIFEDDRFPHVQIRWHGGATFNIFGDGFQQGYWVWEEFDVFTHYGRNCNRQTTIDEAQQIAREHFHSMFEELCEDSFDAVFDWAHAVAGKP